MVCIYKSQDIVIDDCRSKGGVEINVAIANRGGRKEQIAKKKFILVGQCAALFALKAKIKVF